MKRLIFDIYVRLLVRRLHRLKKSIRLECYRSPDCYVITRSYAGQKLFLCFVDSLLDRKTFCDDVDGQWNKYRKCFYNNIYDAKKELYRQRNMIAKWHIDSVKKEKQIKLQNEYLRKF